MLPNVTELQFPHLLENVYLTVYLNLCKNYVQRYVKFPVGTYYTKWVHSTRKLFDVPNKENILDIHILDSWQLIHWSKLFDLTRWRSKHSVSAVLPKVSLKIDCELVCALYS